jgi:hypothetical protein
VGDENYDQRPAQFAHVARQALDDVGAADRTRMKAA